MIFDTYYYGRCLGEDKNTIKFGRLVSDSNNSKVGILDENNNIYPFNNLEGIKESDVSFKTVSKDFVIKNRLLYGENIKYLEISDIDIFDYNKLYIPVYSYISSNYDCFHLNELPLDLFTNKNNFRYLSKNWYYMSLRNVKVLIELESNKIVSSFGVFNDYFKRFDENSVLIGEKYSSICKLILDKGLNNCKNYDIFVK